MATESESETSFLEHLISSRNRDLSILFPLLLGIRDPSAPRRDGDDDRHHPPGHETERIILVNPFTQGMIVVQSGTSSFDALLWEVSQMESSKKGPPPASKASIDAMPRVLVSEEGRECAICLEDMEMEGDAREMPCRHRYHSACIEKWMGLHGSCPVCRYKMPREEGNRGGRRWTRTREIWLTFSVNRRDSTEPAAVDGPIIER